MKDSNATFIFLMAICLIFFAGSRAIAQCYSEPGTQACEYEKAREQEWRDYQQKRRDKYDRWDEQQRSRNQLDTDSPPPPAGLY